MLHTLLDSIFDWLPFGVSFAILVSGGLPHCDGADGSDGYIRLREAET
jgi:hypothetical protein